MVDIQSEVAGVSFATSGVAKRSLPLPRPPTSPLDANEHTHASPSSVLLADASELHLARCCFESDSWPEPDRLHRGSHHDVTYDFALHYRRRAAMDMPRTSPKSAPAPTATAKDSMGRREMVRKV